MFLQSLKQIKTLSLLVVLLNSVKCCILQAKYSIFVALSLFIMYVSLYPWRVFHSWCTRWFKYDRDWLCVNKSQFVPVIFEPPFICIVLSCCYGRYLFRGCQLDASWLQYMSTPWRWPSHEPKRVGGKRTVRVGCKILLNWLCCLYVFCELPLSTFEISARFLRNPLQMSFHRKLPQTSCFFF
jgi:hypothetical protein